MKKPMEKNKQTVMSHLLEFFFVGLVMGITEDMLAIYFATDEQISLETFWVAAAIAIPFAIISEIIVDMKILRKLIRP